MFYIFVKTNKEMEKTNLPNIIQIPVNRDGHKNYFKKVKDNYYIFVAEHDWATYRVIGKQNDIKAFDPSGGPFISPGFKLENYVLTKIVVEDNHIFFVFEEDVA